MKGSTGDTPLHVAVGITKNKEMVEFLINHNADLNSQNIMGRTPLYRAVESENEEIVKILTSHNADVCVRDNQKLTAKDHARLFSNNQQIEEILEPYDCTETIFF